MDHFSTIKIAEIPSRIWNFSHYFQLPVDRSELTVAEYLRQNNIIWNFGDDPSADFRVYKEENIRNGLISLRRLYSEYRKKFKKIPYINLNGEAQENSRIAYFLADPERTYSVAPGLKYKRLYFPSLWSDPEVDKWGERFDRVCWIGRPMSERISIAKKVNKLGIGLDIYSRESWPLPNWKGFAPDEIDTSRKYKYRIVYENSLNNLYHSEKLFNSIRSGCVTFYISDPELHLPHLKKSFLKFNVDTIIEREELSISVLKGIHDVLFGNAWEEYSFKKFFDRIIDAARKVE